MAYFRCGGSKPKEMVIRGAGELSSTSVGFIFDITFPCEEFSKLDVEYFDSDTVKIYGIDSKGSSTTIQNGSVKRKITLDIANYSKVRFYGLNTKSTFFNGFANNIRFYN